MNAGTNGPTTIQYLPILIMAAIVLSVGKDLKLIGKGYNGKPVDVAYYGIITTAQEMQLIRIFNLKKYMRKGEKPELLCLKLCNITFLQMVI